MQSINKSPLIDFPVFVFKDLTKPFSSCLKSITWSLIYYTFDKTIAFSFKYFPTPEIVHSVPTPTTKWVILTTVCSKNSGPVHIQWM